MDKQKRKWNLKCRLKKENKRVLNAKKISCILWLFVYLEWDW
jgi:hypothetical protein